MIEELIDIKDARHIALDYGERFKGWYFSKTFLKKQSIKLNYRGEKISYSFNKYDFNYKFIMPMKLDFSGGITAYSSGERKLGLFRFPRNENGKFVPPLSFKKIECFINMSEKNVKKILTLKEPLIFEAYKIPQFGFEFFDISKLNEKEIISFTDKKFAEEIKQEQNRIVTEKTEEILSKISALPNYLLILLSVLNLERTDIEKVSKETNKIIYI